MRVITTAYTLVRPQDLADLAELGDALVVDIRLRARSWVPAYRGYALRRELGERYIHIPELGNVNYRDRDLPIEIADLEGGIAKLRAAANGHRAAVLLCGCRELETCHRRVVAEELSRRLGLEWAEARTPEEMLEILAAI